MSSNYIIDNNQTYRLAISANGKEKLDLLGNFTCEIQEERQVYLSDDNDYYYEYLISGTDQNGNELPSVQVRERDFNKMKWANEKWGARITIEPNKEKYFANAIKETSTNRARISIISSLGWFKQGNDYFFAHAGGTIPINTEENTQVSLHGLLPSSYSLITYADTNDRIQCTKNALELLEIAPDPVTVPLLGFVFRTVLGDFKRLNHAIHIAGGSGIYKTSVAALMLSFFGTNFSVDNLTANWTSTSNALELLTNKAKDVPLVIDEFKPIGSNGSVQELYRKADRIFRGIGNNAGRQRMNGDCNDLSETFAARSGIISTGEDIPPGNSLRARMLIIHMKHGDVNVDALTQAQRDAINSIYSKAMYSFIEYVAENADRIRETINSEVEELRNHFSNTIGISHPRLPETVANEYYGLRLYLDHMVSIEAITEEEKSAILSRAETAFVQLTEVQESAICEETVTAKFLKYFGIALSSGTYNLASLNDPNPYPKCIAYRDDNKQIYFNVPLALGAAKSMAQKAGEEINITDRMLKKLLIDERHLIDINGLYDYRKPNGIMRPWLVCINQEALEQK